jgi:hypothetical protein
LGDSQREATPQVDLGSVPAASKPDPQPGGETSSVQPFGTPIGDSDIPLAEAPEHFFAQDDWQELINSCGGRQAALARISWKPDGSYRLWQQGAAELLTPGGAKAREAQRIDGLAERVRSAFVAMLRSELVVTGFQHPSTQRERIAAELLQEMVFDFVKDTAEGGGYVIRRIRVARATAPSGEQEGIVDRMTAWLRHRQDEHGDELKKVLSDAAQSEFAEEFTTRSFDAAYSRVYGRNRGRPRKSAN